MTYTSIVEKHIQDREAFQLLKGAGMYTSGVYNILDGRKPLYVHRVSFDAAFKWNGRFIKLRGDGVFEAPHGMWSDLVLPENWIRFDRPDTKGNKQPVRVMPVVEATRLRLLGERF